MSVEDRLAHNEAVFRDVNERIEKGHWPDGPDQPVAFRCECASLGCNMLVELTLRAYEHVRADPRHFVLLPGHEIPDVDRVLEAHPQYLVVEKTGDAGEVAEATDPRGV
jgi:hypothetical protein